MQSWLARRRRRPPLLPAHAGTLDRDGRTPADVVISYLDAMYHWELRASRRSAFGSDVPGEVLDDLRSIREGHLTPRALATNTTVSFGTAPGFDTNGMRVLGVTESDRRRAVVRTAEFPFGSTTGGGEAQEYEYRLVLIDGRWRLNSRTTMDWDGHAIRGLL